MAKRSSNNILKDIYIKLYRAFGPQHWWPAETSFEVAVGAILTQNTNWQNVERAIANLKEKGLLDPYRLYCMDVNSLASLIRPAGYYNVKAKRLKAFLDFLIKDFGGRIEDMASLEVEHLRKRLLNIDGIGPETADSILLYGLNKPVFVVDAYTKRVLIRHDIINSNADYEEIQSLFHLSLERDSSLYNEFHALFVKLGKTFCKTKPLCREVPKNLKAFWAEEGCPLNEWNYKKKGKKGKTQRG
ncbi:MAG: endonuclease III domain-containing protein [Thermodesulfovibrionales bacterium]